MGKAVIKVLLWQKNFIVPGIRTYGMYLMDFTGTREVRHVSARKQIESDKPIKARMIRRLAGSLTD